MPKVAYPITHPVEQLNAPAAFLNLRPRTKGRCVQTCNVVYAEVHGCGLTMDIFRPDGDTNGLGIVDVIGSAWHSDRLRLNEHIGLGIYDVLCARGYTVFAVAPGSATQFTGFDLVRHVHAAIRHIKAEAETYGIHPDRVGLTGASAGGHLAALAALDPEPGKSNSRHPYRQHDSGVRAVGLFFPPTDLVDFNGRVFDYPAIEGLRFDRLLFPDGVDGQTPDAIETACAALSPARRVNGAAPPFLVIHGDADPVVPVAQSERLVSALQAAGNTAELIVRAGGGHPWPDVEPELNRLAEWFDKHLG